MLFRIEELPLIRIVGAKERLVYEINEFAESGFFLLTVGDRRCVDKRGEGLISVFMNA